MAPARRKQYNGGSEEDYADGFSNGDFAGTGGWWNTQPPADNFMGPYDIDPTQTQLPPSDAPSVEVAPPPVVEEPSYNEEDYVEEDVFPEPEAAQEQEPEPPVYAAPLPEARKVPAKPKPDKAPDVVVESKPEVKPEPEVKVEAKPKVQPPTPTVTRETKLPETREVKTPVEDLVPQITNIERGDQRDAFLDFVASQNYPPTPDGLKALLLVANGSKWGAGWKQVGNSGSIDFGDGNIVDVIENFQGGGAGWHWLLPGAADATVDDTRDDTLDVDGTIDDTIDDTVDDTVDDLPSDRKVTSQPKPDTGTFPPGTEVQTIRGDAGGALQAGTDLEDPYYGDIREDPSTTDYPYSVPQQQTIGMLQAGDDPLSELMNAALAGTASTGGMTPTPFAGQTQRALSDIMARGGQGAEIGSELEWGVQNTLQELIANAGRLPADAQRRAMEMETLRNPIEAFRQAQLSQGQAELARRGLLGQGPETGFMSGLEDQLAPMYATAGQQLALSEAERADQRYRDALAQGADLGMAQAQRREDRLASTLQLATGMNEEMSRNLLATAQTWTDRQEMLGNLAIQNLDQNIQWNKFLYEAGLERDQVVESIQTGRLAAVLPILQTFLTQVQTAAQGLIPYHEEDQ